VKFRHAPTALADTPEEAVLLSLRQALVHARCRCTAEIGRVVSTPGAFWWVPTLESSDEPAVAFEIEDTESEALFVEGWCPRHRVRRVAARDLLVQARRAQRTGQRRHVWLDGD